MMAARPQQVGGTAGDNGAVHQEAQTTSAESAPLRNRAGESRSPYVRAHASTPVLWQLLDDEAVGRAKRENKLIFMNIGFLACHCTSTAGSPTASRCGN